MKNSHLQFTGSNKRKQSAFLPTWAEKPQKKPNQKCTSVNAKFL